MKTTSPRSFLSLASIAILVSGCTTEIGPNGQPRSVMTPMGAAAVQAVTAAGIGAGAGALMPNMNSVATGAISAGAGSVGSQAINALIPKSSGGSSAQAYQQQTNQTLYTRSSEGGFTPAKISYLKQVDGSYAPSYPRGKQLFRQLPNGAFSPVN
ncbi:MAG: hypothetical protein WCI42_03960 [Verrucomicrobiota bacterium]